MASRTRLADWAPWRLLPVRHRPDIAHAKLRKLKINKGNFTAKILLSHDAFHTNGARRRRAGSSMNDAARPAPAVDRIVEEAWEQVIGARPGRNDRLLRLLANEDPGLGRSYQIGLLLSEIAATTGVHLPLTVAYASPTAAELARMVQAPET